MLKIKQKFDFSSVLEETAQLVYPKIEELLISGIDRKNQETALYQVATGGKRIRPALAMICSRLLGGDDKDILYPAASLEILHNYSLIIDDIIDNSDFRRGKPTVRKKEGNAIAECIAVAYGVAVFEGANKSKHQNLISKIFARTIREIIDGEILDILFDKDDRGNETVGNHSSELTQKDYFKMIQHKTAALTQACCEVGAICANADNNEIKIIKDYGLNLGIAFQIQDDILDIFGDEKSFGKKIGKDIIEKKMGNIVLLLATEELNQKDRATLSKTSGENKFFDKNVETAVSIIQKTKAKERAEQSRKRFIKKAKNNLKLLPQNNWNELLGEIADFTIKRNN